MKKNGKTIQIFLPSGDPKGIKKTELKTDKVEIIQSSQKDFLENKSIFDFTGVYILVDSLQELKPQVYIGKGRVKDRIYNHSDKKDFWNMVFGIRLKTEEGFNDSHISFMEHYFIDKAKKLKQCSIEENKQIPVCPKLEESIICEIFDYIESIKLLLSTLGLKIFEELVSDKNDKSKNKFYCKSTFDAEGEGEYTEDGFIVFEGAKCRKEYVKSSFGGSYYKFREKLIADGILKEDPENRNLYVLTEDFKFSNPSLAGEVILARSTNGWQTWKNKSGKTLDEVYRNGKE